MRPCVHLTAVLWMRLQYAGSEAARTQGDAQAAKVACAERDIDIGGAAGVGQRPRLGAGAAERGGGPCQRRSCGAAREAVGGCVARADGGVRGARVAHCRRHVNGGRRVDRAAGRRDGDSDRHVNGGRGRAAGRPYVHVGRHGGVLQGRRGDDARDRVFVAVVLACMRLSSVMPPCCGLCCDRLQSACPPSSGRPSPSAPSKAPTSARTSLVRQRPAEHGSEWCIGCTQARAYAAARGHRRPARRLGEAVDRAAIRPRHSRRRHGLRLRRLVQIPVAHWGMHCKAFWSLLWRPAGCLPPDFQARRPSLAPHCVQALRG